jgi:hypothetical protein
MARYELALDAIAFPTVMSATHSTAASLVRFGLP